MTMIPRKHKWLFILLGCFVFQNLCMAFSLGYGVEQYRDIMPEGNDFPGNPPSDAEFVSNQIIYFSLHPTGFEHLKLQFSPENSQSTGLYRVPGKPVTIEMRQLSGPDWQPLYLRIGAHKAGYYKGISNKEVHRLRDASSSFALREGVQKDPDWTSGLIYIESNNPGEALFEITISNAVQAPWFQAGRDTLEQWQNTIRHAPAPWAELQGKHSILTLPSAMIRNLDDPRPILRVYDDLVVKAYKLAGLTPGAEEPLDRAPNLPVRFAMDAERYDAFAVAGVPIYLNWLAFGNPYLWLQPNVGYVADTLVHELGHNNSPTEWAFVPHGGNEPFANLFVYAWQSAIGRWMIYDRSPWVFIRPSFLYAYARWFVYVLGPVTDFIDNKPSGSYRSFWSEHDNVTLESASGFMIHLVWAVSSDFLPELFRRFRRLPANETPRKHQHQERTDFFFEQVCDITKQDLTPVFTDWQVPVSAEAYERVAEKHYRHPRHLYHDGL